MAYLRGVGVLLHQCGRSFKCGSEPARDSCTTRCNHCAAFASGLAPAGTTAPTEFEPCRDHCGSEPARDSCTTRWVRTITVLPSRAGSLPQELRRPQSLSLAGTMVGASLLAIHAPHGAITVLPSRAGSLPQELRRPQSLSLAGIIVGASLLAIHAPHGGSEQSLCCLRERARSHRNYGAHRV